MHPVNEVEAQMDDKFLVETAKITDEEEGMPMSTLVSFGVDTHTISVMI